MYKITYIGNCLVDLGQMRDDIVVLWQLVSGLLLTGEGKLAWLLLCKGQVR